MKARSLTQAGQEFLEDCLASLRSGEMEELPLEDLKSARMSGEFDPGFSVEDRIFASRYELGEYLVAVTEQIERRLIIADPGLANWLTAFYFDQICPMDNGARQFREPARYVYNPSFRKQYRHVVLGSYDLVYLHGAYARLMLYTPLHIGSDVLEQIAARQDLVGFPTFIRLAYRLYWDDDTGRPKIGMANKNEPGGLRRLIEVADQLQLTYDLGYMSDDGVMDILPGEFERWLTE